MKSAKNPNPEIEELRAKLNKADEDLARARQLWMEEMRKAAPLMGAQMDNAKLKKQLVIIGHIAAGRSNEAIAELLEPLPVVINFDVQVVGDKARKAAREELLKSVVDNVVGHLGELKIKEEEQK